MDTQNPFSKGLEKLKRKLVGGSRKRDGRSGNETDRRREVNVERSEASQRNSRLRPEAQDLESGPGREEDVRSGEEVGRADPPTSTSLATHVKEASST